MEPHKIDRRGYVKYATGMAVIAGAAGAYYLINSELPSQTSTVISASQNLYEPTVTVDTKPKYIAALEGQPVELLGNIDDRDKSDLKYTFLINDTVVSQNIAHYNNGYKILSYETRTGDLTNENSVALEVSDGTHQARSGTKCFVDKHISYPDEPLKVNIKGIVYSIGFSSWFLFPPNEHAMDEELDVIRNELGCNGIRLVGDYDDVMYSCAELCMRKGFDKIILNPRYMDQPASETIKRLTQFSEKAEELRKQSDAIQLQIGNEFTCDCTDFLEGDDWGVRCKNLIEGRLRSDWITRFKKLIEETLSISRERFHGEISYASGNWEYMYVPWEEFDIIGVNMYFDKWNSIYVVGNILRNLHSQYDKPVYDTEFGCCTYEGAWQWSGAGSLYSNRKYDEEEQVSYIDTYLDMVNRINANTSNIDACFWWIWNDVMYSDQSRQFSLVKRAEELYQTFLRKKAFFKYASYKISNP